MNEPMAPEYWIHKYGFRLGAALEAAFAAASTDCLRFEVLRCLATGLDLAVIWEKEVGPRRTSIRLRVMALAARYRTLSVQYTAN